MRITQTLGRIVLRLSFAVVVSLSLAACRQPSAGEPPAGGGPEAAVRPTQAGPLWDEPQFTAMLQAFRQKLPGQRRALRFQMSTGSASLEVQDPAKPQNVDAYEYRDGTLSGPSPVNLSMALDDGTIDDNAFDWDKVAVERIPALVKEAIARTKLEGGEVAQVKIARKAPSPHDISQRAMANAMGKRKDRRSLLTPLATVEIKIALKGARQFGWLSADAQGKVTGVGLN